MKEVTMKFEPLYDRVVLRPLGTAEKTASGLFLPQTAQPDVMEYEVVAVGNGVPQDAAASWDRVTPWRPLQLHVGDRVLKSVYVGITVSVEGETFVIVRETEILSRVVGRAYDDVDDDVVAF
jgi:chaperonin GroES